MSFCRMIVWSTWGLIGLGMVSEAAACARCQHQMSLGLAPLSHGIPVSQAIPQAPMAYAPVFTPNYYVVSATGGSATQESLLGPLAAGFATELFKKVIDKVLGSFDGGGANPPSVDTASNSRLTRIEERLDRIEQKLEQRVTVLEQTASDSLEAIKKNALAIQGTQRETLALLLAVPSDKSIDIPSNLDNVWLISDTRTGPRQVTIPQETPVTLIATVGESPDVVTFLRWKRDGEWKVGYVKGFKSSIDSLNKDALKPAEAPQGAIADPEPEAALKDPSKAAPKRKALSDPLPNPPA